MKIGSWWLFILFVLGVIFFLGSVYSELPSDSLQNSVQGIQDAAETAQNIGNNITYGNWDSLGAEWKRVILENPILKSIDTILKEVNFLFLFLFAEPYSISWSLLFVIIFWFLSMGIITVLLLFIRRLPKIIPVISGFVGAIILAQLGLFRKLVDFLGVKIFSEQQGISWKIVLIILLLVLIVFNVKKILKELAKGFRTSGEKKDMKKDIEDAKETAREAQDEERNQKVSEETEDINKDFWKNR